MLTIPDDLQTTSGGTTKLCAAACVVAYRARSKSETLATLVARPTLVRVCRGTKVLHAPGVTEPLVVHEGNTVLMPTGVRLMSELLTDDGLYESTVVSFDPSFLARVIPELRNARHSRGRASCLLQPIPGLETLVTELPHELLHSTDRRLLELRLEELVLKLARGPAGVRRILAQGIRVGHGEGPTRLRAVMQQHFRDPMQLEDFAKLCGRSLASFKRDFRRVYGVSPGGWLVQQRLEYATQILTERELSVTETCYACGFGNLSNFIRAFRRHFGMSPKQWQRGRLRLA